MSAVYDAVVIGAGHNGLAAAAYLSQAGWRVLVLERSEQVGGAAVNDARWRGRIERMSRYAYLVSLLPAKIARELGIAVELRTRRVTAFAPPSLFVDERPEWRAFHEPLAAAAGRLFATFTEPLPSRERARELLGEAWELVAERPLGETLAERFDDGLMRGVVATDALIGTFASLFDRSLRQNRCFLYHVAGGDWRVPVGGMGAITDALARAASRAEIRTRATVTGIEHGPQTSEVRWDGGTARTRWVLGAVAPELLAALEGRTPPPTPEGCQTKVNLLLERLPRLRGGVAPEDAFAGTFHLNEHADELEAAYAEADGGELPRRLPAEIYCHTLTDHLPGAHSLALFGLHTRASLFERNPQGMRDAITERYLDQLDAHLDEPIRDCLARDADGEPCIETLTPLDLERELLMPRGNIFHGDLEWPWAEDDTPAGSWGVETDHPRMLLCGAGARRGGGVSCIGGHNAAMAILTGGAH